MESCPLSSVASATEPLSVVDSAMVVCPLSVVEAAIVCCSLSVVKSVMVLVYMAGREVVSGPTVVGVSILVLSSVIVEFGSGIMLGPKRLQMNAIANIF